jgi:hypothetical protein
MGATHATYIASVMQKLSTVRRDPTTTTSNPAQVISFDSAAGFSKEEAVHIGRERRRKRVPSRTDDSCFPPLLCQLFGSANSINDNE